jgi:hypothetical protein
MLPSMLAYNLDAVRLAEEMRAVTVLPISPPPPAVDATAE